MIQQSYEKKIEQQRKMQERTYQKTKEKQKAELEDRKAHPEKYYKQQKQRTPLKRSQKPIKIKQYTAKKLPGKYQSIFTDDIHRCYITGSTESVVPHHVFDGADKTSSELFHFILPLRSDWHTGTNYCIHNDRELMKRYQILCQEYWLGELHKTHTEWFDYFTKWQVA